MKKKFFLKNLLVLLFLLLIPVTILGSLSVIITRQYAKYQFEQNAQKMLYQAKSNCDLLFDDVNTLMLELDSDSRTAYYLNAISNERLDWGGRHLTMLAM